MKTLRLTMDSLRMGFDNFVMVGLLYLMLPIFISVFMIFTMTTATSAENNPQLPVRIVDEDGSELSAVFTDSLMASGLVELSEDPDYVITIPAGFAASEVKKPVFQNIDSGTTGEMILLTAMDQIGQALVRQQAVSTAVEEAGLGDSGVYESLMENEVALAGLIDPVVRTSDLPDQNQQMRENLAFGYISYIIMILAMSIPNALNENKKKGTLARLSSTPTSESALLVSDYLSTIFLSVIIMGAYIVFHRFVTGTFGGNLLVYLLIAVVFAGVFIALIMLINSLIPNPMITTALVTVVMVVQVMGISMTPMVETGEETAFGSLLARFRLDQEMGRLFEANRSGQFGSDHLLTLGVLVVASAVILALAVLREKNRKEARI